MNWKERIQRANKAGYFTTEDIRLSMDWTTCAVGELEVDYSLLDNDNQDKYDAQVVILENLHNMGMEFYKQVILNNIDKTKAIYDLIQIEYHEYLKVGGK